MTPIRRVAAALWAAVDGARMVRWRYRDWRDVVELGPLYDAAEAKRDVRAMMRIGEKVDDTWFYRRTKTRHWWRWRSWSWPRSRCWGWSGYGAGRTGLTTWTRRHRRRRGGRCSPGG